MVGLLAALVGCVTGPVPPGADGSPAAPARQASTTLAPEGPATTAPPTESPCARSLPATATAWQRSLRNGVGSWQGADGASSIRLPDGRVLWLFGDTLRREPSGRIGTIHNSMLLADGPCLAPVYGRASTEPLPTRQDGHWYWPQHAVIDDGRLFVFAASVRKAGEGVFGFAGSGTDLAEFTLPEPGAQPRLLGLSATPSTGHPESRPQWGAAVTQAGGHTYIYAAQKVSKPYVFGRHIFVARVRAGHLPDLTRWRYWDGTTWSARAERAVPIRTAEQGTPGVFSVHARPDGTFLAVYKEDDYLGTDLVALTGTSPVGPWRRHVLGRSPSQTPTGAMTYLALGHPHLPARPGRMLVTVSRNHTDPARVEADPRLYRPQFREVALPRTAT